MAQGHSSVRRRTGGFASQVWTLVDDCIEECTIISLFFFRCDSIAWNAHKMLGAPLQCSAFITKHSDVLSKCNSLTASYLFQQDKYYPPVYDSSGDKSQPLESLRPVNTLPQTRKVRNVSFCFFQVSNVVEKPMPSNFGTCGQLWERKASEKPWKVLRIVQGNGIKLKFTLHYVQMLF